MMAAYTHAEHQEAIASLRIGDVLRHVPGSLTVTGIVEAIVGPIAYRDFPRMQVQIRWADDGRPRSGDGQGSRAFFNDFFLRNGALCTPGMYGPDDVVTWERVGQRAGMQLDLFAEA